MRISNADDRRLVFQTRANRLLAIVSLVMFIYAAVAAGYFATQNRLEFVREGYQAHCQVIVDTLYGSYTQTYLPLHLISGSYIEPAQLPNGATFCRLHLMVEDGKGPYFFAWYRTREAARVEGEKIDDFVRSRGTRFLTVTRDHRWFFGGFALFFAGVGLFCLILGNRRVRTVLDHAGESGTVIQSGLFGSHATHFLMNQVEAVQLSSSWWDSQLTLRLIDGRRLPLTTVTDGEGCWSPRVLREKRLADQVLLSDFCGVPVPQVRPPARSS